MAQQFEIAPKAKNTFTGTEKDKDSYRWGNLASKELTKDIYKEEEKKVLNKSKELKDELKDKVPFRVVKGGDMLGSLVKGLWKLKLLNKFSYGMDVEYRKEGKAARTLKLWSTEWSKLLQPGQIVKVEDGTKVVVVDRKKVEKVYKPVSFALGKDGKLGDALSKIKLPAEASESYQNMGVEFVFGKESILQSALSDASLKNVDLWKGNKIVFDGKNIRVELQAKAQRDAIKNKLGSSPDVLEIKMLEGRYKDLTNLHKALINRFAKKYPTPAKSVSALSKILNISKRDAASSLSRWVDLAVLKSKGGKLKEAIALVQKDIKQIESALKKISNKPAPKKSAGKKEKPTENFTFEDLQNEVHDLSLLWNKYSASNSEGKESLKPNLSSASKILKEKAKKLLPTLSDKKLIESVKSTIVACDRVLNNI